MRTPITCRPATRWPATCWLATCVLLQTACACGDGEESRPRTPPPAPAPSPLPIAAPRRVATAAAFDLVPTADGALLLWGPPAASGGGIRLLRVDPLGDARGEEQVVFAGQPTETAPVPPDALEVAAAVGGGRLGVIWVGREGREVLVLATHGPEGGDRFAPAERLATLERSRSAQARGRVSATAGGDGEVSVMYEDGPNRVRCPTGRGRRCVPFASRRLDSATGARRRGLPRVLPEPCERALVGQTRVDGVWYHGICAVEEGVPRTTIFAIQPDPEYARAEAVLSGCEPLGLAPLGGGVAVVGRCGDRVDGVTFFDAAQERHVLEGLTRAVACEDGRPTLLLSPARGVARRAPLTDPVGRLAPLLPERVAPPGSRAVWTGEAILVARPVASEVALRRHVCTEGSLARTDPP